MRSAERDRRIVWSGAMMRLCAALHIPQAALALLLFAGCAGYQVGARTLYPPDIHTVYVPIFESNSFRRHLGERLTEAVIKEIELKTPYKVIGNPNADSVLTGRILEDTKRLVTESPLDEPRLLEMNLVVSVTWLDRRGDLIQQGSIPVAPEAAVVSASAKVAPEVGQTIAVGQQSAIQRMAEQIVGLMEAPW